MGASVRLYSGVERGPVRLYSVETGPAVYQKVHLSTACVPLHACFFCALSQPEAFLPVAEIMARTGKHSENFRRFFDSKASNLFDPLPTLFPQ